LTLFEIFLLFSLILSFPLDYLLNSFAEKGHIDISCIIKAALIGKLHRCKDKLKGKRGIAKTNYMYEQENFLIPLQTYYIEVCQII
jgi:hypothetical protein